MARQLGTQRISFSSDEPFLLHVSKGHVPGHSLIVKRPNNSTIQAAAGFVDLNSFGNLTRLSAAETMNISSSSANDTSAGTGTRTVRIAGVDGSGDAVSETVVMAGTTPVETTNSYLIVNELRGLTSGSGELNAGAISAVASTAATTQAQIRAGHGIDSNGFYRVPNGYSVYVYYGSVTASKIQGGAQPTLEARMQVRLSSAGHWYTLFDLVMDTAVQNDIADDAGFRNRLPAGGEFRTQATTDTNDTEAHGRVNILLIQDGY